MKFDLPVPIKAMPKPNRTGSHYRAAACPGITVIDPGKPEAARLRLAACIRVSSDSADRLNSCLAQADFCTKYIASKENRELADIQGIAGTSMKK